MSSLYQHFFQDREKLKQQNKEKYSERTLKYFDMLTEMLEREADYGSSFPYLESVYNYISEHEFISDKQCEIIDRISENPENSFGFEEEPF